MVVTVGVTDFVPPELARDDGQNGSFGDDVVVHPYIEVGVVGVHVMREETPEPAVIVEGLAVKMSWPLFGLVGTVIVCVTLPPVPVHVRVKSVGADIKNFTDPDVSLLVEGQPVTPPALVHDVALFADQFT